jgi:hypothetical protein
MADIIYTFYSLESQLGTWQDKVYLSCECGNEFIGNLGFENCWEQWNKDSSRNNFPLTWKCDKCDQDVKLSFPDCHLIRKDTTMFPWLYGAL